MNTSSDITLDSGNSTPLYLQLAKTLESRIQAGMFHANETIPAERALSESLNISRFTARRAIDVLCDRGLLTRRHGSGTYVNSLSPHLLTRLMDFDEAALQRNVNPGSIWISRETSPATKAERRVLGLAGNAFVTRLQRLRTENGVVTALEHSIIPARYMPDLAMDFASLYGLLARSNAMPTRGSQHFCAVNATLEQARLMNIKSGDALFYVKRIGLLSNDTAVELTHTYYRGDSCEFVSILHQEQVSPHAGKDYDPEQLAMTPASPISS